MMSAAQSTKFDEWEKQIEADSASLKLDHLLAELTQDIAAGRVKPLHGVIDEP